MDNHRLPSPRSFDPSDQGEPLTIWTTPPEVTERQRFTSLHWVFLILSAMTTFLTGMNHHLGFAFLASLPVDLMEQILSGAVYSVAILGILLAHEMGHFLTCRHYRIAATWPYVIPFFPVLFGTMGAVIRIKSPFLNRRQLFDVGIAGPIAGFLALLPVLAISLILSTEIALTPQELEAATFQVGEPMIFSWFVDLFFAGDPSRLDLHPLGWAALFGLLATALNLLPIGQLDGGHIVYGLFGPRIHRIVSHVTFFALLSLTWYSLPLPAYLLFAVLVRIFAFQHPPPLYDDDLPSPGRVVLALGALAILVLSFVPVPFAFG